MTVRRVLAAACLVVGLAVAVLLWLVWIDLTLKLREGPGVTTPLALLPPTVVLMGIIAVIVALVRLVRQYQRGLTESNIVVWSSNLVSYFMLLLFGSR